MIALPADKVVNSGGGKWCQNANLVTCFSRSRFELIQLGIALAGKLAFRSLAVKAGVRAVV